MAYEDQDFQIFAGDNKRLIFEVVNVETLHTDTEIRWSVSRSVRRDPVIEINEYPKARIDGKYVIIDIYPEDTFELRPGRYYHELELTEEGWIFTVALGEMTLRPVLNEYEVAEG